MSPKLSANERVIAWLVSHHIRCYLNLLYSQSPNFGNVVIVSYLIFQVDRVLKPGGIIGLVCINGPKCVDSTSMKMASNCTWDVISQYGMPDKVKHIEDNYKDLVLPYPTRRDHMFDIRTSWSLRDYLDVIMTWSPVNNMIKSLGLSVEEGYDHVTELMKERGMTEVDMKSVYTWSHPCALVTASKSE